MLNTIGLKETFRDWNIDDSVLFFLCTIILSLCQDVKFLQLICVSLQVYWQMHCSVPDWTLIITPKYHKPYAVHCNDLDTNSGEQKGSTRVEHKSRAKMNLQILNVGLTFLQSQNEHLWVDLRIQQMSKSPMTQGKIFKSYITISNKMRKQLGVAFQIGT